MRVCMLLFLLFILPVFALLFSQTVSFSTELLFLEHKIVSLDFFHCFVLKRQQAVMCVDFFYSVFFFTACMINVC